MSYVTFAFVYGFLTIRLAVHINIIIATAYVPRSNDRCLGIFQKSLGRLPTIHRDILQMSASFAVMTTKKKKNITAKYV